MKLLTANFITCAVKACKSSSTSFPLHFRDAVLAREELEANPALITNLLPRLEWDALRTTATELGFTNLPETKPAPENLTEELLKELHTLLFETQVVEGSLLCASCGHEYGIKAGIPNFLLPNHLV